MKPILLYIVIIYLLNCVSLHAFESTTPQTLSILEKIDNDAIIYGNGPKKVYLFIDPNCPNSQDFLTMVYESPKMRETYQYHIFLYELKRMKSSQIIESIYLSPRPLQSTFEYMIGHKNLNHLPSNQKIMAKIRAIESAAIQLGINKRPYLIISKETK